MRVLLFPVALAFACLLAGLYGIAHNQIYYTVSPQYFHEFKFIQFHIAPHLQTRLGASIVGWYASWWMGLIIGAPLYLLCLFIRGNHSFVRTFLYSAATVVGVALIVGLAALLYGTFTINVDTLPYWMNGRNVSDPVAFARAGNMHNFSYMGGFAGMLVACIVAIHGAVRSRRQCNTYFKRAL